MRRSIALVLALGLVYAIGVRSAFAVNQLYTAILNGPSESPPNASPGTGFGTVFYDSTAHTLQMDVSWSGLVGTTTISHIHTPTLIPFSGTANVVITPSTLPGFPGGLTSGSYSHLIDLTQTSTYPAAYVSANGGTAAGAEAQLISEFNQGKAYWNIHTSAVPGGEIRGFLLAPEPAAGTLLLFALCGPCLEARRRRK
jgi:hypothetical protein